MENESNRGVLFYLLFKDFNHLEIRQSIFLQKAVIFGVSIVFSKIQVYNKSTAMRVADKNIPHISIDLAKKNAFRKSFGMFLREATFL